LRKKKQTKTKKQETEKSEKKPLRVIFSEWIHRLSQTRLILWIAKIPWQTVGKICRKVWKKGVLPITAFCLCVGVLLSVMALVISAAVCDKTEERIVTAEQLLEMEGEFDCILVLGCRVYSDGRLSHMLEDRLLTAFSLYDQGVCDRLLMSGDSQTVYYDEVGAMKRAAMEHGIPEEAILTDPAGLSTYDSISHLLSHYEGKRVVIVTQEYHLYRALYVAEKLGVEAFGVSADRRPYVNQWKYSLREIAARCKDVAYALAQPKAAEIPQGT